MYPSNCIPEFELYYIHIHINIYIHVCILEVDQVKENLTDIADGNKSCVDTAMEKVK